MKPAELNLLWQLSESSLQFECVMKLLLEHCTVIIDNIMKLPKTKCKYLSTDPLNYILHLKRSKCHCQKSSTLLYFTFPLPFPLSRNAEILFRIPISLESLDSKPLKSSSNGRLQNSEECIDSTIKNISK